MPLPVESYHVLDDGSAILKSRISSYPVSTPEQFIVSGVGNNMMMLVCGFQGNLFQVWDIRRTVLLMSVEGGSWRGERCGGEQV